MTPEFCSGNLDLLQELHQTIGKLGIRVGQTIGKLWLSWQAA